MQVRITPEECARRIIQRELGLPVVLNDDGTKPRLYDLRIGDIESPDVAIECVGAVDRIRTETWNIGPAKGPLSLSLKGDWHVVLQPYARVKAIHDQLERVLQRCEHIKLASYSPVDPFLRRLDPETFMALDALSIASVHCFRLAGTGTVHLGMTGYGGAVDPEGRAVPKWIGDFLSSPERADVLLKLKTSGAAECHAFVPVSFGGAPWLIESYLGTATELLPPADPELPPPITAAWIMFGRRGVLWNGKRWRFFDATEPASG